MNKKEQALSGKNNAMLNNTESMMSNYTNPSADTGKVIPGAENTIPPEADVIHAKEWVDDGSLL